jgi:hypothetical protein
MEIEQSFYQENDPMSDVYQSKNTPRPYVMLAIAVLVILGLVIVALFVTMGGAPPDEIVGGATAVTITPGG